MVPRSGLTTSDLSIPISSWLDLASRHKASESSTTVYAHMNILEFLVALPAELRLCVPLSCWVLVADTTEEAKARRLLDLMAR